MLTELHIENLGVIERVELTLGAGLTAVTGETGAGKTMLVEAIDFTMQANDSADAVKVRFHEPSRILFVKGPLDAVELIAGIIAAKGMSGL